MKRTYFGALLILFSFFFPGSFVTWGQLKKLQFRSYTTDEGLTSSSVNCIFQDDKGFIWIGTNDGLNRYDGINFVTFKNDPADTNTLYDNSVLTLKEDHNHNMLIGTTQGLSMYNREKDQFLNYINNKSSPLRGINCTVRSIAEDSLGNLWLATHIGLIYFDRQNNKIINYTHDPDDPGSISYNETECVFIDSRNDVWAGTQKGLNLFQPESFSFRSFAGNNDQADNVSDAFVKYIIEDKEGYIWFATYGQGLFRMHNTDIESGRFTGYRHVPGNSRSLVADRILSLFSDEKGDLWIGTENHGLDVFDREKEIFWHYRSNEFDQYCFDNKSIQFIYRDNKDNLWIGTFSGGVHISKINSDAILLYKNLPEISVSLSSNVVTSFLQDHEGRIWVGTDGGGLNLFDINTGLFKHFNSGNTNISSDAVLSVIEDSHHRIWLGTWNGGLNCFNGNTHSFKSYAMNNSAIPDNDILVVREDREGNLWLGSFHGGLIHFDTKANIFTQYTSQNSGLNNRMVIDIEEDSRGYLYIGTPSGLHIFDPGSREFVIYRNEPANEKSIVSERIRDILIENDTSIWIGTQNGLDRFNPETGIFTHYNERSGLSDNVINGLVFDNSSKLWITTNKGLSRLDIKTGKTKNFTKDDGLQSSEFNYKSALKTRDGALLLGGIKGFNVIYPGRIKENLKTPDILITDFLIFNKPVKIGGEDSPLKKNILEAKKITLSHKHSMFTFSFAVMDFTIPEKNLYACMMEGFEKDWNYIGTQHTATYTNLDPGEYTFRVKGANNDGVWNNEGTSLTIIILPAWWQTLIFKISAGLIIIVSALGFYFSRIKRLKTQQVYLEKLVKERTSEIEDKNSKLTEQAYELNETNTLLEERQQKIEEQTEKLEIQKEKLENANIHLTELNSTKDKFFSIIAHDLKNPFNTILGFSELMNLKYDNLPDEKKRRYAEVIYSSSKNIYTLLENLLQWARTQTDKIAFEPASFNINQLVEQNIILLNENLTAKRINVKKEIKESYDVYADSNMINTVIRNLLTNAIKFTNPGGDILISCNKKDGKIKVSIKDTGTGMSAEALEKLFRVDANFSTEGTQGETGTGLGLILCKEFVVKNGGTISVESSPGKGSRFSFTLPANK